jgi:hypothetical protein
MVILHLSHHNETTKSQRNYHRHRHSPPDIRYDICIPTMTDCPEVLQSKDTAWTASDLAQLRAYTEYYTNSTPCGPLEYGVYERFRGWC